MHFPFPCLFMNGAGRHLFFAVGRGSYAIQWDEKSVNRKRKNCSISDKAKKSLILWGSFLPKIKDFLNKSYRYLYCHPCGKALD